MSSERTGTHESTAGAGERRRPGQESPEAHMKQTMAEMMANCHCGPDMMKEMARLMGCCGPSAPREPTQDKT